jgi:Fe-S cluster assembly protein SufD
VFKKLYSSEILSTQNGFESFYKLEDILDFVTSPIYLESIENSTYKKKVPGLHKHYVDNLHYLREIGLPSNKSEQFNFSNLHKLKNIDILNTESRTIDGIEDLAKYEWLATEKNTIVITDGHILSSTDVGTKKPFNVQILDNIKFNKQKQDEYIKIIENTDDFRNLTYALSTFPNIIIFPAGSKDSFYKNPFTIEYANATDDPVLQANTNIVDIQYNTKVKLRERVKSRAGQMNYVTYIVREDAELEIVRNSKDIGGWTLFDSRFVCHPGSKVTVKFKNEGSQYSQENFYFKCSSHVEVDLIGRNNIKKGNEYHQFVQLKSQNDSNKSIIDIKNVGNENANTSFIGKYDVSPFSIGFDGQMSNENLMLTKNVKMHTRPILDIHTKEIECSHGCTISNINKDHLYYLQSRGFSKEKAKDILVDSFLC